VAGTDEAKVILRVTKQSPPEIRGEDLHSYLESCAGSRCRTAWARGGPSLLIRYYIDGQTMLGRLRLVPKGILEDGEEHWLATFHWGPRGGRHHRAFRVIGHMSW
jgi:hypothetical protein